MACFDRVTPFFLFDKFWGNNMLPAHFMDAACGYFKIKFLAFEWNEECKLINTTKLENILEKLIVENNKE